MSQRKAKLIGEYIDAVGATKTGYATRVELPHKLVGDRPKIHECFHSDAKEIKREYARANRFEKLMLGEKYKTVIGSVKQDGSRKRS